MVSTATAATILRTPSAERVDSAPFLAGFGNIFRKEVLEWFRTRRFAISAGLTTLLVGAVPVGVFIHENGLRHGRFALSAHTYRSMMDGWMSLSVTLGTYLMIALTMGILVREEEMGTAQWLFTKPVSRLGYALAKYSANVLVAVLAAVIVPGAIFLGLTQALFSNGVQHWAGAGIALGLASFHAATVIAIILALSTVFSSQAPVAGIVFGLGFLPFPASLALPLSVTALAPVFIGQPALLAAAGQQMRPWEPVVSAAILLPLCLTIACARLTRKQLQ